MIHAIWTAAIASSSEQITVSRRSPGARLWGCSSRVGDLE